MIVINSNVVMIFILFCILCSSIELKYAVAGLFVSSSDQDMEFAAAEPRPVRVDFEESPQVLPLVANVSGLQQGSVSDSNGNDDNRESDDQTSQIRFGTSHDVGDQIHDATIQEILPGQRKRPGNYYKYMDHEEKNYHHDDVKIGDYDAFSEDEPRQDIVRSGTRNLRDEDESSKEESRRHEEYDVNESKESKGQTGNNDAISDSDQINSDSSKQETKQDKTESKLIKKCKKHF